MRLTPSHIIRWLALFAVATLLTACRPTPLQEQQAFVFGTRVEVIVVSPEPERGRQAIAAVLREFDRLHRSYHAWQDSELTRLNSAISQGRPQPVSAELTELVRDAQALSERGQWLFDPGIGRLIALWGFQSDQFAARLPEGRALASWLAAAPSIRQLHVTPDHVVSSTNNQVALDFGGYLKGIALDRAADILRAQGIRNALINIGGNVLALGDKDGRKWRIGIQHPRQPGPIATLELADGEAIGTSGDYQRYFELDGRRYAHLLDPRSGQPVDHTQAVTVLIPARPDAGKLSDVQSKPIFVAGPDHWREIARQLEIGMVMRVDRSGQVQLTPEMQARLRLPSPDLKVDVVR